LWTSPANGQVYCGYAEDYFFKPTGSWLLAPSYGLTNSLRAVCRKVDCSFGKAWLQKRETGCPRRGLSAQHLGLGDSMQLPPALDDACESVEIRLDKKRIGIRIALVSGR
jgi:hypothetical protein